MFHLHCLSVLLQLVLLSFKGLKIGIIAVNVNLNDSELDTTIEEAEEPPSTATWSTQGNFYHGGAHWSKWNDDGTPIYRYRRCGNKWNYNLHQAAKEKGKISKLNDATKIFFLTPLSSFLAFVPLKFWKLWVLKTNHYGKEKAKEDIQDSLVARVYGLFWYLVENDSAPNTR